MILRGDFMKKGFVIACVFSLFAIPVLANDFYAAGDVGQVEWKIDSENDSDIGFGLAGGYKFNKMLAAEIGYRDLGSFEGSGPISGYSADLSATQISVLGSYPFKDVYSVYGRLGAANLRIKASTGSGTDSATKALFGVGVRYEVGEKSAVRLELNRYAKYEELTVSALFFGFEVPI
jgi:OmpA-OmpF porin, OOP family